MDKRTEVALFKYEIIAPAIHGQNQGEYFREMSKQVFNVPHLGRRRFTAGTFKNWLYIYRKEGIEGLKPKYRTDKGKFKCIDEELEKTIRALVEDYNVVSSAQLYRLLISHGHITKFNFRQQTLTRYVKEKKILEKVEKTARKRFEKEHINELWITDFMHGPVINKRKTYLCCIIDDHSRVIVGYGWYLNENSISLEITLKKAISRYGVPKVLYCDNGSAYISSNIQLSCAKTGIAIVHTKPYDPAAKGKIERFFLTARKMFLSMVNPENIEELENKFREWVEKSYNKSFHSTIKGKPIDRFMDEFDLIKRIDKFDLDENFYQRIKRKVNKDSTISIDAVIYEVPSKYIGEYIEIRFASENKEDKYIYENDKSVFKVREVNLAENAATRHIPIFTGGADNA